jgi:predicted exporter
LVQEKILEHFGNHLEPINILIDASTIQDLMEKTYTVHNKINHLADNGKVTKHEDIFQFLPSLGQQREIKRALQQVDFSSTIKAANEALIENQFNPKAFQEFFSWLNQLEASIQDPNQIISPIDLWNNFSGLRPILRRYFFPSPEKLYSFAYFYPTKRITEPHEIQKIKDYFKAGQRDIKVSGISFLPYKLFKTIIKEERHILILAFLSILALLGLAYRRFSLVLFSFCPLVIGMAFLILIMTLLDLRFNFVNIITLPLIMGIGIDDSIHILIRFHDKKNIYGTISETAAAVILTTLTTIAGFGSMVLGNHQGLISLGWIIILGLISCLYTSLFVLPPALRIFCRFSSDSPS